MERVQGLLLSRFLERVREDARIGTAHISLYAALLHHWSVREFEHPLPVFRQELVALCKISSAGTYHRCIRDLHAFGYLVYRPSCNHFLGSLVWLTEPE